MAPTAHVAILGAGLSGLTAAQLLLDAGHDVTVLDKGRGVGGRLATRRIGGATLDHGAQFFTVRGDAFRALVDEAIGDGVVDTWCHGFGAQDGYPRYRGVEGMNGFAKWLARRVNESGGSIVTDRRATAVTNAGGGWRLELEDGDAVQGDHAILTAPVPQTLELLKSGDVALDGDTESSLTSIEYKPTLALMVTLDRPSGMPAPGGEQRTEDDLFTFVADNRLKGLSAEHALTFHVNGAESSRRWDDDPERVIADLLDQATHWLGSAVPQEVQLKKWRYAGPRIPHPDPYVAARLEPGKLVLAGDAFAGPKVEGAFNSGRAAGAFVASA